MKDEGYDQWLKDLKIGDRVIVERSYIDISMSVSMVVRITPKGGIRIKGFESRLFKDGEGNIRGDYALHRLLIPTEERIDEIRMLRIRDEIRSTNWHLIDDDVVKSIYELLKQK